MDELVAFLRARLQEDELVAKQAGPGDWRPGVAGEHWKVSGPEDVVLQRVDGKAVRIEATAHGSGSFGHDVAAHITRWDPARVLVEVQAKRAIIADLERIQAETDCERCATEQGAEGLYLAIRSLAAVYRDHPDYRPEWAPE